MQPLNLQLTLPIQQSSFATSCFLIIFSSEHFPAPTLLTPSDLLGCDAEGFLPHLTLSGNPLLPGLIRSQTSWAPRVYVARPPLGLRVKQARLTPAHSLPSGLLAGPDHFTVAPPSLEIAPPQALMAYPN